MVYRVTIAPFYAMKNIKTISSTLVLTNFRGNEILFKEASSEQKSNCSLKLNSDYQH